MKQHISSSQFRMLVIYSTCSTSVLSMPLILGTLVGRDAWWIPLIGTVLGFPFILLFVIMSRWYPTTDFFGMSNKIVGKKFGKICGLLFTLLPLLTISPKLHYSTDFITTHLLKTTPPVVVVAICMSVVAMGSYLGIEAFGRTAEMTAFFFFLPLILLLLFKIPDMDIEKVLPFFRGDENHYIDAILFYIAITACNSVLLLALYPYAISDKKKAEQAFLQGFLIACSILFFITVLCETALGPELMTASYFPTFTLAQRISFGNFAERVEALLTVIWFITIYFKITLYLFISTRGIAQTFGIKNEKPLTLPLAMIFVFIPLQAFDNTIQDYEFYVGPAKWLSLLVGAVLPLVLFIIGALQRKKKKQSLLPKHTRQSNTSRRV
ncbi:GerAB/ArcD/ProY family transporter [Shouchella patagoniensis]|uniref:GerAB/ArcD/ProY family transporter n=1 Tax=Shouchella patagoniensis TaxID=228576 RepID=UPI00099589AA|nr:endospore germination permease [Shouchella patagoniensis]